MKRVLLAFWGTLAVGLALLAAVNHFQPVDYPGRLGAVIGILAILLASAAALDEMGDRAAKRSGNKACQGPSRNISFQSKDVARWQRPLPWVLLAFLGLNLGVAYATRNASAIVHTLQGFVGVLGFIGLVGVAIILGVRSMHHVRLVFTIHWTEPKRIRRLLTAREVQERGLLSLAQPMIWTSAVLSSLIILIWFLAWLTWKVDPSKPAPSTVFGALYLGAIGLGLPGLMFLQDTRGIILPSRTIGFDSQWMGLLQGQPYRTLWPYDRIARVRFDSMPAGEDRFRLMIVTPKEGHDVAFGLSDEVDVRQVAHFLTDRGVEVL